MKKKTSYKLTIISLCLAMLLISILSGCSASKTYSGLVVTYGGDSRIIELQGDDGKNYGFIIKEDTELIWDDDSAFEMWEDVRVDYDEWDVFSCCMRVKIVPGEKAERTESVDDYVDECVEEWYLADKITVTKVEEDYFNVAAKPVIYLYPEKETKVQVSLDYDGILTCTYPEYKDKWEVTAAPDGTLTDKDGKIYNYLYWEGIDKIEYDFSKGFCVKGEDTATFLENALAKLGLNRREANEFIVYWLPLMQENPYNIISFQKETYTKHAKLNVTPEPDSVIRVFMAWKPSEEEVEMEPQSLSSATRGGFTVVEWGGAKVN